MSFKQYLIKIENILQYMVYCMRVSAVFKDLWADENMQFVPLQLSPKTYLHNSNTPGMSRTYKFHNSDAPVLGLCHSRPGRCFN